MAARDAADESGALGREELIRYSRHLLLPEVGQAGQERLKRSSVLCVGTGGLGSPALLYLAAAGVGRLGLVDFDRVDLSNLQRQIVHGTDDVGRPKVESARDTLRRVNPHVQVELHDVRLGADNAMDLLARYDVIVDGADNFTTRYLINDACVLLGKPDVQGSIFRFEGQVSVFDARRGPCYRCLYPAPPPEGHAPSCAEAGVLGVLPGVVGAIQATEAIKLLLGAGQPLVGRLLLYDALGMSFRSLRIPKDPECPACGPNASIRTLREEAAACAAPAVRSVTAEELRERIAREPDLVLVDVREPAEFSAGHLEGALLLPVGEIGARAVELPRDRPIVVYCKAGVRGARALQALKAAGFKDVANLEGGLMAWAQRIDPRLKPI